MTKRANGALLDELRRAAVSETDECIRLDQQRRPKIRLNGVCMNASRAVWILAHGDPGDLFVLHGPCNDGWCINVRHLYLGTPADNSRDLVDRGTGRPGWQPGERNGRAKLTAPDVLAIRASDESSSVLAARYGVHRATVHRARTGRRWGHDPESM